MTLLNVMVIVHGQVLNFTQQTLTCSARDSVALSRTASKVNGKRRHFALRQTETSQPIITKCDSSDYVLGPYNQTKFGCDPSRGFVSPYTRNIHPILRPIGYLLFWF